MTRTNMHSPITIIAVDKSIIMLASEGREILRQLEAWTEETFGGRCPERAKYCPTCDAWRAYDAVRKTVECLE